MGLSCCLLSSFTGLGSFIIVYIKSNSIYTTIGSIILLHLLYQSLTSLFKKINVFFFQSNPNLKEKYGSWALVTGCTDGIGEAYAKILALEYNLNLVLVSRSKEKLEKLRNDLSSKSDNKFMIIQADFTDTSDDLFNKIDQRTSHLDVRILINNVGHRYGVSNDIKGPGEFGEMCIVEDVEKLIKVNLFAQTKLTKMFLKRWTLKSAIDSASSSTTCCDLDKNCSSPSSIQKQSLCINLSSFSAIFPMPYMCIYPATKQYNKYLIQALSKEPAYKNTTFQVLQPYFVATRTHPVVKKTSLMIPSPENLVRKGLVCVGHYKLTTGHFLADFYATFVEFASSTPILSWLSDYLVKQKMVKMIEGRKTPVAHKKSQ